MLEPGITDGSAVATEPSAATSEGPPAAGDAPSPSSPAAATTSSPAAAAAEQAHDRDGNDVKAPSDNNDTGDNDNDNDDNDDNDDDDEDDETASEEGANTTVFVGSIPFEASEADIVDFFSPCGPIANVKLLLDAHSRRFKGSCFIRFDSADAAQQACALNGNTLMSRKLYISMSTSRPAPSSSPYVFIGNLDASLDVDSLYQFFAGCGTVVNIKLITDKYTGKHRGFGFVEFADDRSAKNSLALNGRMLGSRPIRIDFQRPKAPRSARSRGSGRGRADGHFGQGHHLPPHMHQHMAWPHAPPAMQYGHPFSPNYHMHGHPLSAQPHAGMPHPHAHGAAPAFFPQATRPMHHHPHHHHPHYSPHSPGPFPGYFPGHFAFPPPFHMPPAPESPADHHAAPATPVSPSTERANPSSPPPTSPPTTRHQTAPMLLPYAPMTPEAALASGFGFQMDPYLAYGAGPYAPNSYGPSSPPSMNAAVAGQQPEHFE